MCVGTPAAARAKPITIERSSCPGHKVPNQPAKQNPPAAGANAPAPATPQQNKTNPFETVPQTIPTQPPAAPTPPPTPGAKPPFEALPTTPSPVKPVIGNQNVIEAITFRGSRRVPQETLRGLIVTRKGDVYNEDTLRRDFQALWNTGRFRRHSPRNRTRRDRHHRHLRRHRASRWSAPSSTKAPSR